MDVSPGRVSKDAQSPMPIKRDATGGERQVVRPSGGDGGRGDRPAAILSVKSGPPLLSRAVAPAFRRSGKITRTQNVVMRERFLWSERSRRTGIAGCAVTTRGNAHVRTK